MGDGRPMCVQDQNILQGFPRNSDSLTADLYGCFIIYVMMTGWTIVAPRIVLEKAKLALPHLAKRPIRTCSGSTSHETKEIDSKPRPDLTRARAYQV